MELDQSLKDMTRKADEAMAPQLYCKLHSGARGLAIVRFGVASKK